MTEAKTRVDLNNATGLRVDVLRAEIDCTNGGVTARHNRLLVTSDQLTGCPVRAAGTSTDQVLVVVPNSASGRFVARPISPNGEVRSGSFGGNFIHSGDQRFSEAFDRHPIPVHDRFEDRRRTPLTGDHEISRRVAGALRLLSNSDRTALLADLLVRNLDLESDSDVAGYYWGRNRGARHVGVNVRCISQSIEGEDALWIAPVTRRDRVETSACAIDLVDNTPLR